MKKAGTILIMFIWTAVFSFNAAAGILKQTPHNTVELSVTEQGDIWKVLLKFMPNDGWHIYSHNPGDIGQATEVEWKTDGAQLLREEWSPGEDMFFKGFGLNVYKKSGQYRAELRKKAGAKPTIAVSWTACGDECIPENVDFELLPEAFEAASGENAANAALSNSFPPEAARTIPSEGGLLKILLLAFAGGIILNFMPCVFPILFIKVMALGNLRERRKNIRDAWLYLAGVLTCFCLIAALLWFFKAHGSRIGWGFQLQSPYFVLFMAVLFFILGFMFLDIIQLGSGLKYIPAGSFFTGLLAVLIASPCTAPFMGAALGWVLTTERSPLTYYPVFFALGLGYALPFFVAGLYPQFLRKFLPKPGKWMQVLKRLFAIPMFITGAWLLWILYGHGETSAVWKKYNPEEVRQLTVSGEKVLINFTAKWCITCLVNEKNVFSTRQFADFAKYNDIRLYKADWSSHNSQITEALAAYGRSSIPLYVYYNGTGGYVFLPQLLTMGVVEQLMQSPNLADDAAAEN